MKAFLNNRHNSASGIGVKKILLVLVVCGLFLQVMFPSLTVYGAAQSAPTQKFDLVPDGNVKNYDPRKDGYHALLPVRYEIPFSSVTEEGATYIEILLPVVVFQNHLLVNLNFFKEITGVEVHKEPLRSGEKRARICVFKRTVVVTEGKGELLYYLGSEKNPGNWLDSGSFVLGTPPQTIDGDLYAPLLDLLAVLQIPYELFNSNKSQMFAGRSKQFLQINQPSKTVYDVLAEIKDDDSMYPFSYGDADLRAVLASANIGVGAHEMLEGDPFAWFSTILSGTMIFDKQGQQIRDDKWCDELTKRILAMYEEEGSFLDEINARNAIQFLDYFMTGMMESKKEKATELYLEALWNNLEQPWSKTRDYVIQGNLFDYEEVCRDLQDSEKYFGEINSKLKTVSKSQQYLGIAVDMIKTINTYDKRDKIISNGFTHLFSQSFQKKYGYSLQYLGKQNLDRIGKNVAQIENDVSAYSVKETLCKHAKDIVSEAFLSKQPLFFVYQVFVKHLPFIKNNLNSMDNIILSDYAIHLQYDTRNAALSCLKKIHLSTSKEEEILDGIELVYLYLKCCYVARDSAVKAILERSGGKTDLGRQKTKNRIILQNLAALSDGYRRGEDASKSVLPPTASDLHQELSERKTEEKLFSFLFPMYVKVYGKVLQNTDKKTPVEDADCWITVSGENVGSFSGTEKGVFSVFIPLPKPKEILMDLSVLENMEISLGFSSPTVRGNAAVQSAPEPGEEIDLGVVYLGGNNITGLVLDTVTGLPISGADVTCVDKKNPALFWTVYTDENGMFLLEGISEGEMTLLFSKEEYEDKTVEFTSVGNEPRADLGQVYLDPYIDVSKIRIDDKNKRSFEGHTYALAYYGDHDYSWREASLICKALGGHLVTITRDEEQQVVANLYKTSERRLFTGRFPAWIGASKKGYDAPWEWCTGEEFSYSQEVTMDYNPKGLSYDISDADPNGMFYLEMEDLAAYSTADYDPYDNWFACDNREHGLGNIDHAFIIEWDQ